METAQQSIRGGRPPRVGLALTAALVALGLGVGGRMLYRASYERRIRLPEVLQAQVDLLPDENAQEGTPNTVTGTDIGETEFQVVINQMPTMETGNSPCNILAENPANNPYDLRVSLYLKETGELIGATHRIERGKRVDEIMLDRELAAGEYPLLAKLELFDDAHNAAGQLTVELSLLVRG